MLFLLVLQLLLFSIVRVLLFALCLMYYCSCWYCHHSVIIVLVNAAVMIVAFVFLRDLLSVLALIKEPLTVDIGVPLAV